MKVQQKEETSRLIKRARETSARNVNPDINSQQGQKRTFVNVRKRPKADIRDVSKAVAHLPLWRSLYDGQDVLKFLESQKRTQECQLKK